jgi:hypothetical protein
MAGPSENPQNPEGQGTNVPAAGVAASIHAPEQPSDYDRALAETLGMTPQQVMQIRRLTSIPANVALPKEPAKRITIPIKEAEPFDGNPANARKFLQQLQLEFDVNPQLYEEYDPVTMMTLSDRPMVGRALSLLTTSKNPTVQDFADLQLRSYKAKGRWPSFESFKATFESQFVTTDEKGEAIKQLVQIKMKDAENADQYTGRFKLLAQQAGVTDDEMLKLHYKDGLINSIKKWMVDYGEKDTFDEMCKAVQQRDARWRATNQSRNPYTGLIIRQDRRYIKDIDGNIEMAAIQSSYKRLTPEEREQYQREGKCFRCGRKGHRVRECTQKPFEKKDEPKKQSNNPFRQRQIAVQGASEAGPSDDIGKRAAQIMALMKEGTEEEQKKLKEKCEKDFA